MNEERNNYLHYLFGFCYAYMIGEEMNTKQTLSDEKFFVTILSLVNQQLRDLKLEKLTKDEGKILIKCHHWIITYGKLITEKKLDC